MSDPEKRLVLEMLLVAKNDANRNFQGTVVREKEKVVASAERFLNSEICRDLCEFVVGGSG